ncbi:hypothetical protein F5888DRAFT_281664 [Russula emetica]|nr:hypothetical protein F5888DRAFT_281664 [Russula emetica]
MSPLCDRYLSVNGRYRTQYLREVVLRMPGAHQLPIGTPLLQSMSQIPSTASSSTSNFQSIFNASLQAYDNKTKNKLLDHPLVTQLQPCDSPIAVLSVLQDLIQQFEQRRTSDERLNTWLNPIVNVLCSFSDTLGEGVGLVFSPAKTIFAGIGVLLLAAKDVNASQDMVIDLFERIESFFKRLESYTELKSSEEMADMMVKIVVEVLSVLAIVTVEIKQRRRKKFLKKLLGRNDVEDALKRLDKLTQEEARMAMAEMLKITRGVDGNVKVLMDDGKEEKRKQMRRDLHSWLSPPDSSTNHNISRNAHHEGTATWFFQGGIYKEWRSTPSLLWVHGKPGSGKSVLCSGIIEDIKSLRETGSACLPYFYCDFRDENKQSRRNLVLSILSQLAAQSDLRCDILSRLYSAHDDGRQKPNDRALMQCLKDMVSLPTQDSVYLIIDALDECPNNSGMPSSREEVLDLVQDLADLHLPSVHICVTSRPEIDIRTTLEPLTSLSVSLHSQSGQTKDIMDYVSSVVYSDKKMRKWREEDKSLVVRILSERADGM